MVEVAVHWALMEARGWGGERWCRPFIGVVGRFGGRYFSAGRSPTKLERLLDARPDFAVSGDETTRAAASQLVQVMGQLGAVCAVVEQGRRSGLRWWR
jgi:hypothetical protein